MDKFFLLKKSKKCIQERKNILKFFLVKNFTKIKKKFEKISEKYCERIFFEKILPLNHFAIIIIVRPLKNLCEILYKLY